MPTARLTLPQAGPGAGSPVRPPPGKHDDDLLGDLPPLDDDGREEEDADVEAPEALAPDDDGDPFDDATGEGDPVGEIEGEGAEGGESMLDANPADGLEIAAPDLLGDETDSFVDDGKDDDRPYDGDDIDEAPAPGKLDAGEEGPDTDDESLTDAALPALADDDDGAEDDAEAFFEGDLGKAGRAAPHAWTASLWERFGPPLALPPVRALALVKGGVLVAGRELSKVDLEGAVEPRAARGLPGGEVTRALALGSEVWVTTERGGLFASRDDGASFSELSGWRSLVRPDEAAAGLDVTVAGDGGLWARTAQGSLLAREGRSDRWSKVDVDGFVHAVGTDDGGRVVVLVRALSSTDVRVQSAAPSANGWDRFAVPPELLPDGIHGTASVSARGGSIAFSVDDAGVFRSVGGAWSKVAATEGVSALAMLDAATVVIAVATGEGGSSLLRVGPDGEPTVVAVWDDRGDGEADGGSVAAIAVDDAHEVVWVGGAFGLAAFQPKMRG